ncbi:dihydrofolate reductase [Arthrobacter sp. R1-13]
MSIKLVVAHDRERGIGRSGQLPWSLPGEMKRLSATTLRTMVPGRKNALVMGRATYDSLPSGKRPLPGRLNIVVTSRPIRRPGY